jgi:uncharacterized membrane protein
MKQLSQIIALSVFGVGAIEIIVALGAAIIILQIFLNKIACIKVSWEMKKRNKEIENNMWSIE